MSQIKITAIGSSQLIAKEIAYMCQYILGNSIPIEIIATKDVIPPTSPNQLFVCANTQKAKLQTILPNKQLFIFDLRPTTTFFLKVASIPQGETVYIFNNLSPYIEEIKKECNSLLGNKKLHFKGIAYEELSMSEMKEKLREAKFIIGVDQFLDDKVLLSPKYKEFINPSATIIPGKRTPSIKSASSLLEGICNLYLASASPIWQQEIPLIVDIIRIGIERIVTSQVDVSTPKAKNINTVSQIPTPTKPIEESIKELTYLRDKLRTLNS